MFLNLSMLRLALLPLMYQSKRYYAPNSFGNCAGLTSLHLHHQALFAAKLSNSDESFEYMIC